MALTMRYRFASPSGFGGCGLQPSFRISPPSAHPRQNNQRFLRVPNSNHPQQRYPKNPDARRYGDGRHHHLHQNDGRHGAKHAPRDRQRVSFFLGEVGMSLPPLAQSLPPLGKNEDQPGCPQGPAQGNISFSNPSTQGDASQTPRSSWTNAGLTVDWSDSGNWSRLVALTRRPKAATALVFDEANVIYGGLNTQNPSINDIPGLSLTSITINGNPGDQFPISGDAITLTGPGGISNNMPNLLNIAGTAITTPGYTTLSFAGIGAPDQQSPAATADTWSNTAGTLNVTSPISLADATGTPGARPWSTTR